MTDWKRLLATVAAALGLLPVPLGALVMGIGEGSAAAAIGGAIESALLFWPALAIGGGFLPQALNRTTTRGGRVRRWYAIVPLALLQGIWVVLTTPVFTGYDRTGVIRASVRADLRNLPSLQEIYYQDEGVYTADRRALAFTESDGVLIRMEAWPEGWSASAEHTLDSGYSCAIYGGEPRDTLRTHRGRVPPRPEELFCQPLPPFTGWGPFEGPLRWYYELLDERQLL